MQTQSASEENLAASIDPPPRPRSPWRVASVQVMDGHRLRLRFLDGLEGEVDMSRLVHSQTAGVFAPLADPKLFAEARVELGAVTWPGGLDLAPDAMHRAIKAGGAWVL